MSLLFFFYYVLEVRESARNKIGARIARQAGDWVFLLLWVLCSHTSLGDQTDELFWEIVSSLPHLRDGRPGLGAILFFFPRHDDCSKDVT